MALGPWACPLALVLGPVPGPWALALGPGPGPGPWALGPALAYQSTRPTHPIQEREPLLDKGTSTIQGNLYYTMEPEIRVFESMQVDSKTLISDSIV